MNCLLLPTAIGFVLTLQLEKVTNYLKPFSITLRPCVQEIDENRRKLKGFASMATMERIKGRNEPCRLLFSVGGLIDSIASSESVRKLAELMDGLKNMGTDIQVCLAVRQLHACAD